MRIPWTFRDPATDDTYELAINPDKMTSPHRRKSLTHARGSKTGLNRARSWMAAPTPVNWQFEGNIRTEAFHAALLEWAQRTGPIEVTDHFGRTWLVAIQKFEPIDRKPTATTPWRMRYRMHTLNLGQLSDSGAGSGSFAMAGTATGAMT